MIQVKPHPVFAGVWLVRFLLLLYAHVQPSLWFAFWVSFSFFPIEIAGLVLKTSGRDQLSEIVTWCVRKLSKPDELRLRGWNLLCVLIALVESMMVYRLMRELGEWPVLPAALLTSALTLMLVDHWLRPDIYG